MKFNFKSGDMVTCRVVRTTKINSQTVQVGSVVKVIGNVAKQLLSGANPACTQMMEHEPEKYQERDTEVVVSTPDPVKKVAPKKKAKAKEPKFDSGAPVDSNDE